MKTIPTAVAGSVCLLVLAGVGACTRHDQGQAAASDTAAAQAAASSAEASASDAQASAALARAARPAAGTVANASGDNQKTAPPEVSVSERIRGSNEEAPQDLREKADAARAPRSADRR